LVSLRNHVPARKSRDKRVCRLSVIGFDDVPAASIWSLALSTVTVYTSATGRLAAQALLRVIAGKSPPVASSQRLLSQLVVRGSTGTVPK
jgi:LacI family transcriptional regulator, galactose operon repressor